MTNHNPNITSSTGSASLTENSNSTGSAVLRTATGTMNFKDSDNNDTHTTSAALKTAVASGGTTIPATSLAHLNSAMSSTILIDSNTSGKLKWTFSTADSDFDFLAKNQTLVLTYEITLRDNHGGLTKKNVTVTITGTDDKPVIEIGADAVVSEQEGMTLSFSPDTAHIAVNFVDPDLANTGHSAQVIGVTASGATGGILPGALGTAELMSFFHIDNVVKEAGSSNGVINTTFSAPDLAFDYLADGESIDITYTIKLSDNAGMNNTQTVVVTVLGTNDEPCIIGFPETRNLTEGEDLSPAGELTACGDFHFTDIDLSDTHTVSTSVTATRSGGGAVPLSEATLLAALTTSLDDGFIFSEVDWNFALDNDDVSFLNSGETLTLTYNITVTDPAGGSDTEVVTIIILGTNDPVVMVSGPQSASLAEFADTTGSAVQNTTFPIPTDSLAFTDTDLGDTHTVSVAVASTVWSGGPAVPSGTDADLPGALLTTLNDSTGTGSGSIDWTFSIADQDLDFLAAGETLTVVYDVTVSDGPTDATQTVTITVDGANDAVVVTGGPGSASVEERPNQTGSTELDTTSPVPTGSIAFDDVDLNDTHQVIVTVSSAVWSFDPTFVFEGSALDELTAALLTTLNDSAGSGAGSVDWTFSIQDRALDFLAAGETLTITYDVAVSDGVTSSSQTVTITATGAEDELIVNAVEATLADTVFTDTDMTAAFGNVIADGGDSAGDAGTTLTISNVNGSAANVGAFVAGTYGNLLLDEFGGYTYVANAALDPLTAGENFVEVFDFTVTDGVDSISTTLTINVLGANDASVITAADSNGSITEDAGPTILINGAFETGDLTGWTASGSITAEFVGLGGEFGNYAARLAPTSGFGTLSQVVETTPGQLYTVGFFVTGDAESSSNSLFVTWDGVTLLALADETGAGFTHYTFDVVAGMSTALLEFTYSDDGVGIFLDQVSVNPTGGFPTGSTSGTIFFSDIEAADTHEASFVEQNTGYVGMFSLGGLSEGSGSGSVGWSFTVDNADIQFLGEGESLTQVYTVFVTDDSGATAQQDVTVTLHGANDAPTTVGPDNVITNAGVSGAFFIPTWTLTGNDSDTDTGDALTINSITATSGLDDAFLFGGVIVFDDAALGGSFDYDTTDGALVSPGSGTVTIANNDASTTTLTGTGGNDIIIATVGGEALDGAAGNDILIGNSGSHVLTGGSGDDIFAFQLVPDDANAITDFDNLADHDLVAISASAFGGGLAPGQDLTFVFESTGDSAFASPESRFHYDTTSQTLLFSADGTDANALVVATFQLGVLLNANDLLIV